MPSNRTSARAGTRFRNSSAGRRGNCWSLVFRRSLPRETTSARDQKVTVGDTIKSNEYDFASIMTHEAGHFLGLAHSGDPRATMNALYQPGNTAMRELTADDIAGICAVYHPDGKRSLDGTNTINAIACDPTPRREFTTVCTPPPPKPCGGSNRCSLKKAGIGISNR